MTDVAVVVPCYNEAQRIRPEAFERALASIPRLRFRCVDDGSTDDTARVLQSMAVPGRLAVHRLAKNSGKAEAVRRGILAELERGAELVGYWDADLATPLDEIPAFIEVLDSRPEIDVVLGSRIKLLGREIERRFYRHAYGRVFATAVSTLLGLDVYDTQCGAKLLRNTEVVRGAFADPFLSRWIFDVEMLARLIAGWSFQGLKAEDRIVEQPLRRWVDVAGSKIGVSDAARAFVELGQIELRYRRSLRSHRTR